MKQQKAQETKFHYYILKLYEDKNAGIEMIFRIRIQAH